MPKKIIMRLSELQDDVEVSAEHSHTIYTVAELKREILELREPHHETKSWFVADPQTWNPDAERMLEDYIEREASDLYEDAYESMWDRITSEHIARIQAIMEEAFGKGFGYWNYGKDVEIDIFPPSDNPELLTGGKADG